MVFDELNKGSLDHSGEASILNLVGVEERKSSIVNTTLDFNTYRSFHNLNNCAAMRAADYGEQKYFVIKKVKMTTPIDIQAIPRSSASVSLLSFIIARPIRKIPMPVISPRIKVRRAIAL